MSFGIAELLDVNMDIVGIILCCCYIIHETSGQLTQTPSNVATKVGQSVSLSCAGKVVKWSELITSTTGNEQEIASGQDGGDLFNSTRYMLTTEPPGNYKLTIISPSLQDGGKYRCTSRIMADHYKDVQVIVFESDPVCTTNVTNGIALEGDYVEYSCKVKYQGNWVPGMEWKNNDGIVEARDESSGNTLKYSYIPKLTPKDNGHIHICRTYFHDPGPDILNENVAHNIPTTDELLSKYMSPLLTVYYGPHLIKVESAKESYSPGDKVRLSAESNPSTRTYKWVNTATQDQLGTSDIITITDAMLGKQTFKVIMCNIAPVSPPKTICKEDLLNITVTNGSTSDCGVTNKIAAGALAFLLINFLL